MKSVSDYQLRFAVYEGRAHVRVFGPVQQERPDSPGHWAGQ